MKNTSFFSKIISDLKSERETQAWREQDTIEISYPAISKEDLRDHWLIIPFLLLFCGFMVFGITTTLPETISTITDLPSDTPPATKYVLLVPIALQAFFAIGLAVFLYRKVIRALFLTEKLTLHPSYFVYSHGIWGNFKEILRVKKEALVSFAISGNNSALFRFISKASGDQNHLYVHYDKQRKKEIMGGRSDDEYIKMIDILESYRTSADIYSMAIAAEDREKQRQKESGSPETKKKKGLIKRVKILLGPEPLEEKDCLKTNGILGLMMLPSIILPFISKSDFSLLADFLIIPTIAGTLLVGGYLLARFNQSLTDKVLVLHGIVICLLVFFYTFYMWYVAQMVSAGKIKIGMGHAPGILAYGLAYGIKQVICFSGTSSEARPFVRKLPLFFFIIGACCDALVISFIFNCFNIASRFK